MAFISNGIWKGYEKPGGSEYYRVPKASGKDCNALRWNDIDKRHFACPGTLNKINDYWLQCSECGRKVRIGEL